MNHLRRLIAATALGLMVSGPAAATIMEMTFTGQWETQTGVPSVLPAQTLTTPKDSFSATVRWNADNVNDDVDPQSYSLSSSFNPFDENEIDLQLLFTPKVGGGLVLDSDSLFGSSTGGVSSVGILFHLGRVIDLQFSMGRMVGGAHETISFSAAPLGSIDITRWEYNPTPSSDPDDSSTLSATLGINDGYAVTDPVAVTVAVPEPASVALVGLALAAFGFSRRRRA